MSEVLLQVLLQQDFSDLFFAAVDTSGQAAALWFLAITMSTPIPHPFLKAVTGPFFQVAGSSWVDKHGPFRCMVRSKRGRDTGPPAGQRPSGSSPSLCTPRSQTFVEQYDNVIFDIERPRHHLGCTPLPRPALPNARITKGVPGRPLWTFRTHLGVSGPRQHHSAQ